MDSAANRFQGCVLGLALGDALGAPLEGGVAERMLWRLIGRTRSGEMRWTDDTQMSLDVIESLLAKGGVDPDDLAARFAASYRWSRGYGPATSRGLKRIQRGEQWNRASRAIYQDGSFGNGAAMRAPMIGLFYAHRPAAIDHAARTSAMVSHAHPLGIEGAVLVARATAAAALGHSNGELLQFASDCCELEPMKMRLAIAQTWCASREEVRAADVKHRLGNGIAASESCVTALYLALRFRDRSFMDMQQMVAAIGGDTDTIGAMAGAIWGAANGVPSVPAKLLAKLEQRERLSALATALYQRARGDPT